MSKREAEVVDGLAGEERGDDLDGVVADGLDVGEEGALAAEGVEVGEVEVAGAVLEELVVGELVEDDPDEERVVARGLRGGGPGGVVLLRAGLPAGDPEQLSDAADGEDGEEDADGVADAEERR